MSFSPLLPPQSIPFDAHRHVFLSGAGRLLMFPFAPSVCGTPQRYQLFSLSTLVNAMIHTHTQRFPLRSGNFTKLSLPLARSLFSSCRTEREGVDAPHLAPPRLSIRSASQPLATHHTHTHHTHKTTTENTLCLLLGNLLSASSIFVSQ